MNLTWKKLGILNLKDLLHHFPTRYLNYGSPSLIKDALVGEDTCFKTILRRKTIFRRRFGRDIVTGVFYDQSSSISVVWFNSSFVYNSLIEEKEYFLAGKITFDKTKRKVIYNPQMEPVEMGGKRTTGLVPIYPLTQGISHKWLASKIGIALKVVEIKDPLDKLEIGKLLNLKTSFQYIHIPQDDQQIEKAQKRFAFNDLLAIELKALISKQAWESRTAPVIKEDKQLYREFCQSLYFKLTDDQQKAIREITRDLGKKYPTNRLLAGDVGSGKTVIAAYAALLSVKNGLKVLLLAPTQILAAQHYKTLQSMLKPFDISVGLVIAGTKSSEYWKKDVVIGTHALLHRSQTFTEQIGLVIIDEQHRFGVMQRAFYLKDKELTPHLLTLSATPIPRTVAMSIYGYLQISRLLTKPKNRKSVKTWIIPDKKRKSAVEWLKEQIDEFAAQVYWVCPFVDQSESENLKTVKAVTVEYEKIKTQFESNKVGLLHGRLKAPEKDKILRDFRKKKYDILVTTPVIEVGIDIANATIMVIEGSNRFGLAQLHQLRGRVGRSAKQSYCLLFIDQDSDINQRLSIFKRSTDGLELARQDLVLRGPGDVFGTNQSGYLHTSFKYFWDTKLRKKARKTASEIAKVTSEAETILVELDQRLAKSTISN